MHSGQSFSLAHTNTDDLWIIDNENMAKSSTQFLQIWSNGCPWALGLTVDHEYRLINGFVQRDVTALLEGCDGIICDGLRFWVAKGKQIFHIMPSKEPRLTTDPDFMKHKELWHERLVSQTHTFESHIVDLHTSNGKVLVVTTDGSYLVDDCITKLSPSTQVRRFIAAYETILVQSDTLEEYGRRIDKPDESIVDMAIYQGTTIFLTATNCVCVEEMKLSVPADKLHCAAANLIASYQNVVHLIRINGYGPFSEHDKISVTIPKATGIESVCCDRWNVYIVDNFGTLHIIPISTTREIMADKIYESSFPEGATIKIPEQYGKSARK